MNIRKQTLAPLRWCMLLIPLLALFAASPRAQADQVSCSLSVPPNPLSSAGLATPWTLAAPCHEGDPGSAVFVQGVVFDKAARTLSTYSPLVIDAGTTPAITPTAPVLSASSDVALYGGGDDDATTLTGAGAGSCVNGASGRVFGQVFFCGTAQFWKDVNAANLSVPPLGTGADGQICPTVRSFKIVDQDQSDNVQTTYLVKADGTTAQNTAANRAALSGSTIAKNPSDNRVLSINVDGALGCRPWTIPDLADGGTLVPTQATDELQAARYQAAPIALIPAGDPMVGPNVLAMVNAYRQGVDQRQIKQLTQANTIAYCGNMKTIAPPFLAVNKTRFENAASPVPALGGNLYDFLQARLAASFQLLHCP